MFIKKKNWQGHSLILMPNIQKSINLMKKSKLTQNCTLKLIMENKNNLNLLDSLFSKLKCLSMNFQAKSLKKSYNYFYVELESMQRKLLVKSQKNILNLVLNLLHLVDWLI